MQITRIYSDVNGESRFESHEVSLAPKQFAPPAPPLLVSASLMASGCVLMELPVRWGGNEWHPSPTRQMFFCLSGSVRVTASSGETLSIEAGDGLLMEDTSGKGHVTEVTSAVPVRAVMIRLG